MQQLNQLMRFIVNAFTNVLIVPITSLLGKVIIGMQVPRIWNRDKIGRAWLELATQKDLPKKDRRVIKSLILLVDTYQDQERFSKLLNIFMAVANQKLLAPLQSISHNRKEWYYDNALPEEPVYRNIRYPNVFYDLTTKKYYDTQGIIFQRPTGENFLGEGSQLPIYMPYMPNPRIVKVDNEDNILREAVPDKETT